MANRTANVKTWLRKAVLECGEPLEAIVLGKYSDDFGNTDDEEFVNDPFVGVVLTPDVALAKLDTNFSNGLGGLDCYPIWAWTKSWVFFIHEYDGSTQLVRVPRNPMNGNPGFSGKIQV